MTPNLKFISRETFCHTFPCGRRIVLKINVTEVETRFLFEWLPALTNKIELTRLSFEYGIWMGYWLKQFEMHGTDADGLRMWEISCRTEFAMRMNELL